MTVADDLLKNDGRKFLDLMEHLAERRMQKDDSRIESSTYFPDDDEDAFDDNEDEVCKQTNIQI